MKNIIAIFAISVSVCAFGYANGSDDPSTLTNWTDKVEAYRQGLHKVSIGKIATPNRDPREPSATAVNLFIEGEILAYNSRKAAELVSQFPYVKASDYATWKNMTNDQKRSFRRRYRAAWLEAFVDTTAVEYNAWRALPTDEERKAWEETWSKDHKGCTEFVVPELIENAR